MAKFKLYLTSIHYTGRDIGDDIHTSILALGQHHSLDFKLKNGQKKIFEPLEFIGEGDFGATQSKIRRKISITVIERDPQIDDEGMKNTFQVIKIASDSQFEFSQSVEVLEDNNLQKKDKVGYFTFNFVAVFPPVEQEGKAGKWFPKLAPPLLNQSKPQYLPWSCNPICIFNCAIGDWNCILDCCTENGVTK